MGATPMATPEMTRFDAQFTEYKKAILPKEVTKCSAIEMGVSFGWHKYVGLVGDVLSIDAFGTSAPGEVVLKSMDSLLIM